MAKLRLSASWKELGNGIQATFEIPSIIKVAPQRSKLLNVFCPHVYLTNYSQNYQTSIFCTPSQELLVFLNEYAHWACFVTARNCREVALPPLPSNNNGYKIVVEMKHKPEQALDLWFFVDDGSFPTHRLYKQIQVMTIPLPILQIANLDFEEDVAWLETNSIDPMHHNPHIAQLQEKHGKGLIGFAIKDLVTAASYENGDTLIVVVVFEQNVLHHVPHTLKMKSRNEFNFKPSDFRFLMEGYRGRVLKNLLKID
jgi:hypothetical protein